MKVKRTIKLTNGECLLCKLDGITNNNTDPHEIYEGRNRQLSIMWGMVVDLCFKHHRLIHDEPSQKTNRWLKAWGQRQFERLYPNESFIKIFDRNYKEVE